MESKLPYYMAYPMPLMYDDERRERMDFEYMKSMYPDAAKRLLPYVEDECDRMEYEGSMMFDEHPDRLQMLLMGRRVLDKTQKDGVFSAGGASADRSAEARKREGGKREGDKQESGWLWELIQVMLYQEIYKRRCDHRKYCRKFYPGMGAR